MQIEVGSGEPCQRYEGPSRPRALFVSGVPGWSKAPYDDSSTSMFNEYARRVGIGTNDYGFACVLDSFPRCRKLESLSQLELDAHKERFKLWCNDQPHVNIFVPTDNLALNALTTLTGIHKWHLSILETGPQPPFRKCMPLLSPEYIFRSFADMPFFIFGIDRLKEELASPVVLRIARDFRINPTFTEAMTFLDECSRSEYLSFDIETREGQITCIGFALTPHRAMCIPALPENWANEDEFYALWNAIRITLESPAKKVGQNAISYDCAYLARYGIAVRNMWHDTMHAQRFLNAELPQGLDTIARLFTREPYWKDEGKDWKNVRDYDQFYVYNCKDCAITLEAALAQRKQMRDQGSEDAFVKLVMSLAPVAAEMSWRGLPLDKVKRDDVRLLKLAEITELEDKLALVTEPVIGKRLNPRSPAQVKDYLKTVGIRIPIKKGKETSDMTALMKLQGRYPNEKSLALLIELSERNKMVSSYLNVEPYADGRIRSSFYVNSTESNRWTAGLDPWGHGLNAQTLPSWYKGVFEAPPGWTFLEVDLRQADARFVAWDAAERRLIEFFTAGRDIHRFVAASKGVCDKPEAAITKAERQLGKKTGHGANYGMSGARHADSCLLEMGLTMSVQQAQAGLDSYHALFPGIRIWQLRIQQELRATKRLTTPFGRTRVFYGRLDEDMFRKAYAFKPSSVVADTINCLLKHVEAKRDRTRCLALAQVHDSGVWLVREDYLAEALAMCRDEDSWNPTHDMRGGRLRIPIEAKVGTNLGLLKEAL